MGNAAHDQATGLRRLFARDTVQVLSVRDSSDCGATAVTLDLATALVALGHRPLIVDLEKGQAAIALGLKARYELAHVLSGDKTLGEVLLTGANGVSVLPAMRGFERVAAERGSWKRTLTGLLRAAPQSFNVWLINGGAEAVAETESPLLVIAPTRDALTSAYAEIKSLARDHGQREFRVVVDRAASESAALSVYKSIAETSRRFLSARLNYCGYLPQDEHAGSHHQGSARTTIADAHSPRAHAFSRLAEAVFAAMPANPPQAALNMGR
jgi:flagellar biosynthesis protein FlhG